MKILDRYILKSFFVPFIATFLIILFVLVMQALWLAFDQIAGKGISMVFILKFLYYTSLIVSAQALPIAILLSSIMTLGTLSENYEFAAAKSAAISLPRLVRPLVILTLGLSILNFLFLNNVYPYAILKQKNLKVNIQKKKPALALVPGSFNSEIPNYQIKFDEKYGEEENLLKNVLIYDLSSKQGNKKVITGERGKIITEEGSKYMTFIIYDGHYYEEHQSKKKSVSKTDKMPGSSADFKEYSFNIDISSFSGDVGDDQNVKGYPNMLSLQQLADTIPNIKYSYDEYLKNRSNSINATVLGNLLIPKPDSTAYISETNILDNFDLSNQVRIANNAITTSNRTLTNIRNSKNNHKRKRKTLNLFDTEYYNRVAFSLSCLVLFFIGAPLGSIIRKGGFGLPMIMAISIYVVYFFTNTFGRNLAEDSSISAALGSWVSVFFMAPIAFFLTRRATKDMGIFNIDVFLQPISNLFKRLIPKKKTE